MRTAYRVLAAVSAVTLAACSAIPDQGDATGFDTVDVINNIRCEAHDALLQHPGFGPGHDFILGLQFDFDTQTTKGAAGEAVVAVPVPLGTFSIGFDGGVVKTRYGEEKVSIAEAFTELRKLECTTLRTLRSLVYPITGNIGLSDVIDKYLDLESLPKAKVSDYFRTLRFTLKLGGGVHPTWALVRSSGTKIDAGFDVTADREDIHEVKVVITPNVKRTAQELIDEKTVFVRLLDGKTSRSARSVDGVPVPTDTDSAKDRAIRALRDESRLDTLREIERRIEPF